MKNRSVVILAGGKSKRFESHSLSSSDKAIRKLGEKTLLENIVKTAGRTADEVLITVSDESRREKYDRILKKDKFSNVRVLVDEDSRCDGPLRGIMTGLKHGGGKLIMTLPCDVPLIKPEVLDYLFQSLDRSDAAVPTWPNGSLEPLIGAFRKEVMARVAEAICWLGRQRPDDLFRSAPSVNFVSVEKDLKPLDPDLDSFVNINYPQDLAEFPRPTSESNLFSETLRFESGINLKNLTDVFNSAKISKGVEDAKIVESLYERSVERGALFWSAAALERKAKILEKSPEEEVRMKKKIKSEASAVFRRAGEQFEREAGMHVRRSILFLATHALLDGEYCWRRAGAEQNAIQARIKAEALYDEMGLERR
ncbi:hypothetical protein AKJ47_01865 [candidate division MSBL1 archaeon SCGC-AAA261G05]|uniref:Probable molybdenum cofactor guanylyltransferase n=2 Tax=candidate division MSBL1 TaxID=215777 RepID=A0A133V172_9EURY|nr:hypothetical protein AKJ42_01485 [candidate division MSBL1 archaeon SCGC-AAA261C02]KXB03640.1 hypothetical protein AKJ47_01865 [candidate division MSBL1 archaeon SCGC-AAA261G05]